MRAHADSAAAIGACRRSGIGRVRHVVMGQLWVQEGLRRGDFRLFKVRGESNPADALTKLSPRSELDKNLAAVAMWRAAGRAVAAPRAPVAPPSTRRSRT